MSIRRTGLLISCALLALIAGAQTKEPAKKSPARAASPMIVESGSEKWGGVWFGKVGRHSRRSPGRHALGRNRRHVARRCPPGRSDEGRSDLYSAAVLYRRSEGRATLASGKGERHGDQGRGSRGDGNEMGRCSPERRALGWVLRGGGANEALRAMQGRYHSADPRSRALCHQFCQPRVSR